MLKKISTLTILATLLIPTSSFAAFSDVPDSYIYHSAINKLQTNGCIKGYEDGSYRPENSITRTETLKLLLTCLDHLPGIYSEETFTIPSGGSYVIDGKEQVFEKNSVVTLKVPFDPNSYPDLEFTDIQKGAWYEGTLKEALIRKIITGYADKTVRPTQTVSKAELYTMLFRLLPEELQKADLSNDVANDVFKEQWFAQGLKFALDNGLLSKDANGNMTPMKELTRGHVAHFINQYKEWLSQKIVPPAEQAVKQPTTSIAPTPPTTTTNTSSTSSSTTTSATTTTNTLVAGSTESGVASFYSGVRTANGELYDPDMLTAAHKTLPFGSIVKVTNPTNGQWVKVAINDRGPFVEGRILDLSKAAFESIANISAGVVNVTMEVESIPNAQ